MIDAIAEAIRAEIEKFHQPARHYIEGEASLRWASTTGMGEWECPHDDLESYRIIARAALAAAAGASSNDVLEMAALVADRYARSDPSSDHDPYEEAGEAYAESIANEIRELKTGINQGHTFHPPVPAGLGVPITDETTWTFGEPAKT